MTKVKICGLTRPQDVAQAVACGADFVGFVLAPSRRQVSLARAVELLAHLNHPGQAVAVVVDVSWDTLQQVREAGFEWVQCHGRVPENLPAGLQGWRAASGEHWNGAESLSAPWWTWLLDGPQSGSGVGFNWSRLVLGEQHRIFVAGGLNVDNVKEVVDRVRPFGVDVSSGVENAPGIKDAELVRAFIERTKNGHH